MIWHGTHLKKKYYSCMWFWQMKSETCQMNHFVFRGKKAHAIFRDAVSSSLSLSLLLFLFKTLSALPIFSVLGVSYLHEGLINQVKMYWTLLWCKATSDLLGIYSKEASMLPLWQRTQHCQGRKVLHSNSTYLFFSSEEASMSLNSPAMWTMP